MIIPIGLKAFILKCIEFHKNVIDLLPLKKLGYKKINISAFMGPDIMLLYIYSSLRFNAAYCYI